MALPVQPTSTGFHNAPVCKSLAVLVGGLHLASNVPSLQHIFRKIFLGPEDLSSVDGVLRCIGSKLVFPDTRSAVISCVIIYFFRVFERRYGSLKFTTNLLFSWLISVSLEVVLERYFETRNFGPLALIIPLFVPWYTQIPLVSATRYGPISLSSKSINYLLGLQIALVSKASAVATASGILSGLLVYCTSLKSISLPDWVGSIFYNTIGRVICTEPVKDSGMMGATLEIQRTQQSEAIEQQLMRARNRYHVPVNGGGRQLRLDEMWAGLGQGGAGFGRGGGAVPAPAVVPSPAHLQTLTDMGFSRERAEQALRQARNNLDDATNILLQDIM